MTPLTVVPTSTRCASGTSLFGSFSLTSGNSPTANPRGLLTPHLLTTRTSYVPGGTSLATVTVNRCGPLGGWAGAFGASFFAGSGGATRGATYSPLMPGCENNRPVGS